MSSGQYVATRPFSTTHRQYEIGDMIDTSRITSSELNAGVMSGAIEPAKFIDTAARLAALNPVLGPGVHAYETDTGVHKIGTDGVTRYNDLGQVGNGTYARRATEVFIPAASLMVASGPAAIASDRLTMLVPYEPSTSVLVAPAAEIPQEWATFDVKAVWCQEDYQLGGVLQLTYQESWLDAGEINAGMSTVGTVTASAPADNARLATITLGADRTAQAGKMLRIGFSRVAYSGSLFNKVLVHGIRLVAKTFLVP